MPEPRDPSHYDPRGSEYRPEPAHVEPVYLPMAERVVKNFAREFGTVGDPPVRFCQIEDLDAALGSLGGLVTDLLALRAKHRFCRSLMLAFGYSGVALWDVVMVERFSPAEGGIRVRAMIGIGDGALLIAETNAGGELRTWPDLYIGAANVGEVQSVEEAEAKRDTFLAGTWTGNPAAWDYAANVPTAAPEPPPARTVWQERKAKEEEIAFAVVDYAGPQRNAAAFVAKVYGVSESTVRRYVARVAARAALETAQEVGE